MYRFFQYGSIVLSALLLTAGGLQAQTDRREVRAGNRKYGKGKWQEAEIDYRRALVKDSVSFAANYNLASALYRRQEIPEAGTVLEKIREQAPGAAQAADYYYNSGNVSVGGKQWQQAVEDYKQSLLRHPDDMEAKENYIYAKKMWENQQKQQQKQQQNPQDKKQQDKKQNPQDKQPQDPKQNPQDQPQQNPQQPPQNQPQDASRPEISPKQARQLLQAIQAKEKATQDKVKKEKAAALKSRRKEKNW